MLVCSSDFEYLKANDLEYAQSSYFDECSWKLLESTLRVFWRSSCSSVEYSKSFRSKRSKSLESM